MEGPNNPNAVSFSSFEGDIENIQPLKRGRNPHALKKSFKDAQNPILQKNKLIAERKQHETAIENYIGEDPLALWLKYIRWTENAYPSGGFQSHLLVLLEKCTRQFKDDARYRQDIRYLRCWVLYSNLVRKPDDIFKFLYNKKIGVTLSLFYLTWAAIFEDRAEYGKADQILSLGITIRARPLDRLKKKIERLQLRVVEDIKRQISGDAMLLDSISENEEEGFSRTPLEPVNRRGERITNGRRGLPSSTISSRSNAIMPSRPNARMSIYHDTPSESQQSRRITNGLGTGFAVWNDYGTEGHRQKENHLAPTPWNTGPLYTAKGRTEEERKRRQRHRVRRRDREMKKRNERRGYTVFCDTPQDNTPTTTGISRSLHNLEAGQVFSSVTERKDIGVPSLTVHSQDQKEGVLTNNPLQYIEKDK